MLDYTELAYQMVEAYHQTTTRAGAVAMVKDKDKDADDNILLAMWLAIDAHCDMAKNACMKTSYKGGRNGF